ncbi:MAG: hypothetical protein U5K43_10680 [Halofilum sp. (in: g-proteobacteria)]|nr:hypothetical protein [Halofilum sp. (in: g-proteobacteria)]
MTAHWSLVYEGYDAPGQGLREALCTLGNGHFATRGAAPEAAADAVHYPGTYLAGGYNRRVTRIAGRDVENEDLVNLPNWLPLTFRVADDPWYRLDTVELLDYRQELDLAGGILSRELRLRDAAGRTTRWRERRLVSMADCHVAGLAVEITPEDWSGRLTVQSALDGNVTNAGVERYRDLDGRHLEVLATDTVAEDTMLLQRAHQPVAGSRSRRPCARTSTRDGGDAGVRAPRTASDARRGSPRSFGSSVAAGRAVTGREGRSRSTRHATRPSPRPAWRRARRSRRSRTSKRCWFPIAAPGITSGASSTSASRPMPRTRS